ncbi:MAG: serine/threonine-protein phosphatase [Nocardioides sp.]|nr:serine/threonine-protein phosphatase [Nocardioides sp.]
MSQPSTSRPRDAGRRVLRYVPDRVEAWRTGSWQSQLYVLAVLLLGVGLSFTVSLWRYPYMPLTTYFIWLLLGMLLLRFRPLALLSVTATSAAVAAVVIDVDPVNVTRVVALCAMAMSVLLVLFAASRQRSGLPSTLSEAMLSDLRDRLQSQGKVPDLPTGWLADSAMIASHGVGYAGDFLVAEIDETGRRLEMVLVDVCGKGVAAGAQALHFAGALGGLLGALDQPALFHAANAFLLRQHADESFSTAVHLRVDLQTGEYAVTSAGHPPALRWDLTRGEWVLDNARGMALGIMPDPDLVATCGVLAPGEALLFYTDGVVESRAEDLDVGIEWLRSTARDAVSLGGYAGAARRIVRQVTRGDDDRAVLILSRGAHPVTRLAAAARPAVGTEPANQRSPGHAPGRAPEPAPGTA